MKIQTKEEKKTQNKQFKWTTFSRHSRQGQEEKKSTWIIIEEKMTRTYAQPSILTTHARTHAKHFV